MLGLIATTSIGVAAPVVEPGEWRLTWTLEGIQGRKGIPPEYLDLQTVTAARCLDRVPALPLPPGQDRGCQIDLVSAVAQTIAWQGQCVPPGGTTRDVQGRVAYRGSALEGTLSIITGGVTLKYDVRGRLRSPSCR